jgi:hypothetical protein
MKILILLLTLILTTAHAQTNQNSNVGSPPNAVSHGQDESSGISESPAGTTKKEAQEHRNRASSMGGAPNVGAGMGTGTGAGSSVGKKIKTQESTNMDQ